MEDKIIYANNIDVQLGNIFRPVEAILCNGTCSGKRQHESDIELYFDDITNALRIASIQFESCFSGNRKSGFHPVAGWNDVVSESHSQARKCFREWRLAGRPRQGPELSRMSISRARFKYALRRCKCMHGQHEADAMAKSFIDKDYKAFWKKVKRKTKEQSSVPTNIDGTSGEQAISQFWHEHYSKLLNSVSDAQQTQIFDERIIDLPTDDLSLTASQIKVARGKLKPRKSAGLDGLNPEHFICATDVSDIHMALCFKSMLRHSFVPTNFMPVKIVPIVKNPSGDVTSSSNYRPVAIASSFSKVFEIAMLDKLDILTEIPSDNQFGFKKQHSTDQAIFMLKERIRKYINSDGPVYCTFLDASKAFDRVCYATLFNKMLDKGFPTSFVKLLKFWYEHQSMYVSWNGLMSQCFNTANGVRQGGILSPCLFAIYLDFLSSSLNSCVTGCYLNLISVNHIIYADDICLISPSFSGMQKLLDICGNVGTHLSIKFNPIKSVSMVFLPKRYKKIMPEFDLILHGTRLIFVKSTTYLGHVISNDLSDENDMLKTRRSIYAKGNTIIRKFSKCSSKIKETLFRSYITPLYCSHLWVMYSKTCFHSVKVAYNSIFRYLFKIPRFHLIDNLLTPVSISEKMISLNLPTFEMNIRKSTYSMFSRCYGNSNSLCNDLNHEMTAIHCKKFLDRVNMYK